MDAQFRRHRLVRQTLGAAQDHAGSGRTRNAPLAADGTWTLQKRPLRLAQNQNYHRPASTARHLDDLPQPQPNDYPIITQTSVLGD